MIKKLEIGFGTPSKNPGWKGDIMAEVRVTTKKVVALILNEVEAKWLKDVMQNEFLEEENDRDRETRHEIFNSLDSAGI